MAERWRPVIRYESHYEVSDLGRVRRVRGGRGAVAGRILSRYSQRDGYRFVQLSKHDRKRTFGVHVLVSEAFLGKRPRGKLPNHRNLIRSDNRLENLEWLTRKQNAQHALSLGRRGGRPLHGESNGRAKLDIYQVRAILEQKGKLGQRALARLCGVSKSCIQFIHQRKHWKDLRVREFPEMRP